MSEPMTDIIIGRLREVLGWATCEGDVPVPVLRDTITVTINELSRLRAENERLREALGRSTALLEEYLHKTPLGHQPHMIAHKAEAAIVEARTALEARHDR